MSRKQPVSVAGIEFDAMINSSYGLEASSPDYVVESGFTIGDSIILKAETLDLTLFVSDRPVTFRDRFGNGNGRVEQVVNALQSLYYAKTLIPVTTPDAQYDNMAIQSLTISRTNEFGYAREIPISLKHIRTTATQTTTIPEGYGKGGASNKAAGTASTSSGSTGAPGSANGSGSNSGSSDGSNGKRGSIAYSMATSMGLL